MDLNWYYVAAGVLGIVAVLDLLYGNTNAPLLPSFISNYLTQNTDLLLLVVSGILIFVAK